VRGSSQCKNSKPGDAVFYTHTDFRAGDIITKKRNRLLEESSSALLLLKHWLKQTEVNPWEKWGYEELEGIAEAVAGEGRGRALKATMTLRRVWIQTPRLR
jgi:hypothetical protein